MRNFMVVDVEADIYEQAPYNIGIVIGNQDNVIETKNIIMTNHIKENRSARYAPENLSYFNLNRNEFLCYDADEDFAYDFYKMVQEYDIKELYAYNVKFDWRKLSKIMPEEELKKILTPCDIMTAAFFEIMDTPEYVEFCKQNDYKTEKGYPSATFETVYQFYTGNKGYNEVHMGLADALDEYDLLRRLGVKSKKGWKPIQPWRRMKKI